MSRGIEIENPAATMPDDEEPVKHAEGQCRNREEIKCGDHPRLPDGGADIASAHSTASRYGRMTFWTRLIWANFVRAALFGFRVRSR
jgi:hypothetical protein